MANDEWQEWELGKLFKLYRDPDVSIDEIDRQLPRRTQTAIRLKASREGIPRGIKEPPSSFSGLLWRIHERGNRYEIIENNLSFKEAAGILMSSDYGVEATGFRGFLPVVSLSRVKNGE